MANILNYASFGGLSERCLTPSLLRLLLPACLLTVLFGTVLFSFRDETPAFNKSKAGGNNTGIGYAQHPNPPNGRWVDAWATSAQLTVPLGLPPAPFDSPSGTFINSSIRQTIPVSISTTQVRLKISNEFSNSSLSITFATLALPPNNTAGTPEIIPHTLQNITFGGRRSIQIPPGANGFSDPINLVLDAGSNVAITLYLQDGQKGAITSHDASRTHMYWAFGDHTNSRMLYIKSKATQRAKHWYFISALEAWVPPSYGSLIILGDSLSDGRGSNINMNNRWPNLLAARVQRSNATKHISVVNMASGGNRVLSDDKNPNVMARLNRDVLAHPGVKYVLVYEGLNDVSVAELDRKTQDAVYEGLIRAYQQLILRLHAFNLPVFFATIAPAGRSPWWPHPERERVRQKINKWIRKSTLFEAVVDFDEILRDEEGSCIRKEWDSGDGVHPNGEGFLQMAEKIDLDIFERWKDGVGNWAKI
ncbi:SGNH hydrolase [Amniculicola lignicola CBS 123094]|uniref:SGNH hydrolase n=1 Tax=Amniculicola lignicola CBS 123094 TaxID=1392246 RepID=A0A6A5WI77_9PLEO|nr:SGNH hydrolase [Amniculicola lignicola CBS 123094]